MRLEPAVAKQEPAPRPIIVRQAGHGSHRRHHTGTWKIAYADFVTAMMAFFLLLWLVNATTEQQRTGIAEYFNPTNPFSRNSSGAGQPFGGQTLESDATLTSNATAPVRNARRPPHSFEADPADALRPRTGSTDHAVEDEDPDRQPGLLSGSLSGRQTGTGQLASAALQDAAAQRTVQQPIPDITQQGRFADLRSPGVAGGPMPRRDAGSPQRDPASEQRFAAEWLALRTAAQEIRATIDADPQLRALGSQMLVEEIPEGLRIQMIDGEGHALFATGVAAPNERGRALLLRAASVIARLPHPMEIAGHTDAAPFRSAGEARSNWELSVERANAARRLMLEAGVAERRVRAVTGRADQELLRPNQPLHPSNRRVSVIIILNQPPDGPPPSIARPAQ